MSLIVVYDACVLYPSTLRDLLIRLAQARLVQAKWTDRILDEVFDNIGKNRPDLDPDRLLRTRNLMNAAVADVLVPDYEPLIDAVRLPDPDDRHVLAAAVKAGADVIVTANLKDFPAEALRQWNVQVVSPDAFVRAQLDLDRDLVYAAVTRIADSLRHPPGTIADVLARLERDGLIESVAVLRGP
jgi:predicted nucleic acid-binding protein